MSSVKSQREQTDAVEEPDQIVVEVVDDGETYIVDEQALKEELDVYKIKPGSKQYCKHSARLPVLLVAERTADRPAHIIQGFHCFDCGRDIAEKGKEG
jgi:hypothetical protein